MVPGLTIIPGPGSCCDLNPPVDTGGAPFRANCCGAEYDMGDAK